MKTRKMLPAAALALLLLANVVVLAGVAWNRAGEPASALTLSAREFGLPWRGFINRREDSAMTLRLAWRSLERPDGFNNTGYYYSGYGSQTPDWLDGAKMRELGFVFPPDYDQQAMGRYVARQKAREVFLVLELDGPAYRQSIVYAGEALARAREMLAAKPGDETLQRAVEHAENEYRRAQDEYSRLFVVDAGLDAGALRARYPGRAQYAIVRGRVAPSQRYRKEENRPLPGGYLQGLAVDNVHVPAGTLPVNALPPAGAPRSRLSSDVDYLIDIAWGQRYEPWIVAASAVTVPESVPESADQTRE